MICVFLALSLPVVKFNLVHLAPLFSADVIAFLCLLPLPVLYNEAIFGLLGVIVPPVELFFLIPLPVFLPKLAQLVSPFFEANKVALVFVFFLHISLFWVPVNRFLYVLIIHLE